MRSISTFWRVPHSITAKLSRIYLVVAISSLFIAGLTSQIMLYQTARTTAHHNLKAQAAALAGNLESAVSFSDAGFAMQTLNALQHYQEVQMAAVVLQDGKIFARYGNAINLQVPVSADFMDADRHGVSQIITSSGNFQARLIVVASLDKLNQEALLTIVLRLILGAAIVFASYEIFRRMCRTVTLPIESLTAMMRIVEREGDHSQRANIASNDEVGELAKGFNAMLASLEMHSTKLNMELDERKCVQEKLDRLAHYDAVTHLPNRHYFTERLKIAMARSQQLGEPMALMFVDLDNFKRVNDTFGHHVGDILLRTVAERLSGSLRTRDVVCRLGGDEFAIIVEHLQDTRQLTQLADKLIVNLTGPLRLENNDLVVTGSIGIAVFPEDADNSETLLRFADVAMYAAKSDGKNAWRRFDPEMASMSTLRMTLENRMRQSLQENHFEVVYQPQIDMSNGEVSGVEALARWNHPEHGVISPAQFIPVAEETGLIRPLGEWVLRTACRQIAAWNQAGQKRLTVSVNVSPRQLVHPDFAQQVLSILEESGCPATQLELEITERVLMQHSDTTRALLQKLRIHGIGIAIDDFGTGYSSMAQLKNMPVTKLKIDKSFIDEIVTNRNDQAITSAMITLASNLQITVIAEGVEEKQQVSRLQQYGCQNFQGYHFSKPLRAHQIPDFMTSMQRRDMANKVSTGKMVYIDFAGAVDPNARYAL